MSIFPKFFTTNVHYFLIRELHYVQKQNYLIFSCSFHIELYCDKTSSPSQSIPEELKEFECHLGGFELTNFHTITWDVGMALCSQIFKYVFSF